MSGGILMKNAILTKAGKLRKKFLPAVYFDSSVVIDYWMTDEMEYSQAETGERVTDNQRPDLVVVRKVLQSDVRINKVLKIREKLLSGECRVTPIVSPLVLLEFMEWHAEAWFKQFASEAVGAINISKKSKKDIGKYLGKVLQLKIEESARQEGETIIEDKGLEILWDNLLPMITHESFHGLEGLLEVEVVNFSLSVNKLWKEPIACAFLQLGAADIMHILLAQHLGCQYLAGFDEDFKRAKDIVQKETGILVLTSPDEILDIL